MHHTGHCCPAPRQYYRQRADTEHRKDPGLCGCCPYYHILKQKPELAAQEFNREIAAVSRSLCQLDTTLCKTEAQPWRTRELPREGQGRDHPENLTESTQQARAGAKQAAEQRTQNAWLLGCGCVASSAAGQGPTNVRDQIFFFFLTLIQLTWAEPFSVPRGPCWMSYGLALSSARHRPHPGEPWGICISC